MTGLPFQRDDDRRSYVRSCAKRPWTRRTPRAWAAASAAARGSGHLSVSSVTSARCARELLRAIGSRRVTVPRSVERLQADESAARTRIVPRNIASSRRGNPGFTRCFSVGRGLLLLRAWRRSASGRGQRIEIRWAVIGATCPDRRGRSRSSRTNALNGRGVESSLPA